MSELIDDLKSNIEESSQNLERLIADIQGMSNAETEFSKLKENLGEAAKSLSQNAENYGVFLTELKSSNQKFSETIITLKSLEPKEIKDKLDEVVEAISGIKKSFQKIEASLKQYSDSYIELTESSSNELTSKLSSLILLVESQSEALTSLEHKLKSRTFLIPLMFLLLVGLCAGIAAIVFNLV